MCWLITIAVIFAAHLAFIFVFGARKPIVPSPVKNAPSLALVGESSSDWLALNNATLFALPDRDGFAGQMWVELPPLQITRQDWTEPPRWLALSPADLGAKYSRLVQTNRFANFHIEYNLSPPLAVLTTPTEPLFARDSALQVQGEIAKRPLLTPLKLPLWPNDDVIAPSVVQVLVDAAGNVFSAVLLPPEIFLEGMAKDDPDADRYAVELARAARFVPLAYDAQGIESNPTSSLAVGQLIFNWQTVPISAANGNQ